MIKVWTDNAEAGLLDRHGERGSTFAYLPAVPAVRATPRRQRQSGGQADFARFRLEPVQHLRQTLADRAV